MPSPIPFIRSTPALSKLEPHLLPLIFPAIKVTTRSTKSLPPGASRIGGLPDLPANESWPQGPCGPMTPIAMLRFSEIHAAAPWSPLPAQGLLYLWFDSRWDRWGSDPADARGFAVRFFPDEPTPLTRRSAPPRPDLTEQQLEDLEPNSPEAAFILGAHTATFESAWTFENPHPGADRAIEGAIYLLTEEFDFHQATPRPDQLLGRPDCFQSPFELIPPGPLRDELSTEEFAAAADRRPMNAALLAKSRDWLLLADIGWEGKSGWLDLGDAGQMLWSLHKDDLARKDFSKVWLSIQCG